MERFYHIRVQKNGYGRVLNNGGATVHLESIEGDPLHVRMRVAYCNPGRLSLLSHKLEGGDVFSKKLGRAHCVGAPARVIDRIGPDGQSLVVEYPAIPAKQPKVIALRDIPSALGRVYREVHRRAHEYTDRQYAPEYDHRIREWLPRE